MDLKTKKEDTHFLKPKNPTSKFSESLPQKLQET